LVWEGLKKEVISAIMLSVKFCEKEQTTMMKRLLSLILAASLSVGIVLTAPLAAAFTYSQAENEAVLSGNVAVDVTNSYVNVRKGPGLSYDVVGTLHLGDKITITETKEADGYVWGKFEGGWIALNYTNYDDVSKVTGITVTVTGDSVNLRKGPGTNYAKVGTAKKGDKLVITQTQQAGNLLWGEFDGGWISLKHTNYDQVTAKPDDEPKPQPPVTVEKTYGTVIKTESLTVRSEPDGTAIGKLNKGDKVEILEQKTVAGRLWGRYEGGWICMRSYVELETVSTNSSASAPSVTTRTGKVTASALNVRSGAGTGYTVVAKLYKGETVEILETVKVDGEEWGKCSKGWVSLEYVVF
jgi:uncharacterized protein YgiM (DUF1202 family)